ncbi:MAG TPA: peptidoglycan-binding protein [Candidatus Paceibacterota bacterium]|jgi:peptidoglycan hydrolase-like protein with peptidoglycan-binding domain
MYKTIAKVLAVLAIVGLIASSFAIGVGAQTTTAVSHASPIVSFSRDLTIGSMGSDVTALQNWLIGRGFVIAAGATGYFGGQTQAALARYQASVGISPAAGYFGPITRARILSVTQGPAPEPVPGNDGDGDDRVSKSDARDAIDSVEEALTDARDEVEEADDDGTDTDDAEDFLENAEDRIDDAEEAFLDEDYEEAVELVEEAEDLIGEALDEVEETADDSDDDGNDKVSTSAELTRVSGADNDYATFEIEFELRAFGDDIYLAQDEVVSLDYEVQDSDGNEVTSQTRLSAYIDATAEEEGSYYVVEEDESERFMLTVVFDPLAVDEGQLYRLQLLGVHYNDTASAPDQEMVTRPESTYRTNYVHIAD